MDDVLVFDKSSHILSLRSGDLIRKVSGRPVKNITEFKTAIQQSLESGVITVLINRVRRSEEKAVTLEL